MVRTLSQDAQNGIPARPQGVRRPKRIPSSPAHPELPGQLRHRGVRAGRRTTENDAGGLFSALLRASLGRRESLLKHRAEAEVGNGIFEVGVQPLEGSHVRVGDVFHREGDPFFALAKWSDRMPELISVEDNEIAWLGDQLKMLGLFYRVVLE